VGDVGAHKSADPGGIHIGDLAEIQHQGLGIIGADPGLEIEEGGKDERPSETQNALPVFCAGNIFDDERLLWHREILDLGHSGIVKAMLILTVALIMTGGRRTIWR